MDPLRHPRSYLYRPVYYKYKKKHPEEAVIPTGRAAPTPPPDFPGPSTEACAYQRHHDANGSCHEKHFEDRPETLKEEEEDAETTRLPMLIASYKIVVPAEATRDVLSGRVPYLLVEDEGVTMFRPVHMFAALKLKKETIHHLEDYGCVGAHERLLETRPRKRVGLGYRRKYISPELIGKGIFGTEPSRRTMGSKALMTGYGPRA